MASIEARDEGTGSMARPARLGLGVGLVGLALWLATAFATWAVDDPSLSYSNDNSVRNMAGAGGAVVADLAMQVFGLGAVLVPLVLAIRGILCLIGRRAGRAGQRAWVALGGLALASAALGSLEAPAGWPLPIGLGGIVGDLLLKIPALATGAYPTGAWSFAAAALFAAPALWCILHGAGLVGAPDEPVALSARRASKIEEDDGEGRLALLAGVASHWAYRMRSAAARVTQSVPVLGRREDPFSHRDWDADAPLMPPAPPARFRDGAAAPAARREVRVVVPPEFREPTFDEPVADHDERAWAEVPYAPESAMPASPRAPAAAAPEIEPAAPTRRTVDTSRATVRHGRSDWNGSYKMAQRQAAIEAAAAAGRAEPTFAADEAGDEDLFETGAPEDRGVVGYDDIHRHDASAFGHDDELPFETHEDHAPYLGDDGRLSLEERIAMEEDEARLEAPERASAPEEGGGWRDFIANNIVAFPGLKRAPKPEAELPRAAPVEPRMAPAAPAPAAPAPRGSMFERPARVVPQAAADAVSRQSSRARLAELGNPALNAEFELPPIELLSPPKPRNRDNTLTPEILQENARLLEGVLDDFGVKGEIIEVRPGPVVTLYELEPAPGIKSSRVIGLADDIARSMSAIAARVAVIPGKNAIGIELPNAKRETVYFREMIQSETFAGAKAKLALALGKTIGGEAVIADLAKMPHLLVAGTTGSGKSVSINTMILSLLYRMSPAECRMIMIDPKMLELSIYDGIPHLLAPVVTDPKKAVVALKWTVKEMEDRYRKMSKVGVRNIDGFNTRVSSAIERGETMSRTVQTGFDRETGEPIFESEEFDLQPLPYIVVIIDEMADLMMVAGKDIEGTVQRLAQMARAAGIHVIMATQRPSVDVITGTIKANFPTRISFQVTSKIDSRTILQEQGAEQLLGMGDMLFMAGGGRIQRVHGPFVDDAEVEEVVKHLKAQGTPEYLDAILEEEDEDGTAAGGSSGGSVGGEESADLYDQAVAVVLRDGKASTSYVQRRLQIGYNRAASIIERMEREGIVGPANHAGKREILVPTDNA
ncbi:DNA translocase FtsK [Aureimonas phyllosphaerae]|uniref:DNA translocase FtsK n=1 Tax=Aureimonas phyllosphaerae TaxID=1166078 RepID=A0A7W6FUF9_9HYPH|nr:DNA translocase FtsK [Aureimonas phyllosphaerae]MBB3936031.1 DNA segregation ATPase FtsK/SpoIIIE-like protein [Aureimonas phyllosphaerae]MBB3960244.1 DNA segregation ATPase FtsK/SpoIIIE-like protein [Aureimonas phyllosphaerae]SFF35471.1 DNA segregation ATPase FtsK/SpoIIIE [Aureimonas phyllosphaerae]